MIDYLKSVQEFIETFGGSINHTPKASLGREENELRYELMKEENEEYLEAVDNNDIIETADALGDMLYILCGTILRHGMQYKIKEVFEEIHRSNMSKIDENGNPVLREDGKILKGKNYFKPDIKAVLNK